ncbi:hypothetical protein MBLNU457_4026t1 [Dothideomycetes sp. NU457]
MSTTTTTTQSIASSSIHFSSTEEMSNIPTNLPSRYQVRRLTPADQTAATAILCHSNTFYSSVFTVVYPYDKTMRFSAFMKTASYLVQHQIESGHSFGVFDTEYVYRSPSSAATHGAFTHDPNDPNADADSILAAMDFPLVSVALSYDAANPLDMEQLMPLINTVPIFGTVYAALGALDQRDPKSWVATGPKQVLMRNGTSTRHDYEGKGIMAGLARWVMRYAAREGFRGVQIECLADAVTHVWANPPAPFSGGVVAEFDTETYQETDEETGGLRKPFGQAKQKVTKIYVHLR